MEDIEKIILNQVHNGEVNIAESNNWRSNDEFELCMNLLEPERRDKEYDWMSDIHVPEFASHFLTQSSIDVSQYFQTRDFVEVYLEDESEIAKQNAGAATELINRTLNQRKLHHYLKFVRGKGINNLVGRVYGKCWWDREEKDGVVGYTTRIEELDVDIDGNPIVDETVQVPETRVIEEEVRGKIPTVDSFNYDIWDQRNVFTSTEYVYSVQDKQFITFRSEATIKDLERMAGKNGYFNLDKLKDVKPPSQTKFRNEAAEKELSVSPTSSKALKPYDIYERYGKYWVIDPDGKNEIGIDENGEIKEKAEYMETIITWAESYDQRVLIGFRAQPFKDALERRYRPILRGLCYVHLTEDGGIGDGKYTKELQVGIDDTFNVSQDRVMLATLPTLKTSKHDIEDNSTIYIEPGHNMELNDPNNVQELQISDNITGALQQIDMLTSKMQQVDSVQPPTLGETGQASTTATAYVGASRATGERTNYKSLTFENTFLTDLYWMVQQMTYQYATEETAFMLMGEKMYDFDPSREDYFYKPLSQSIEPEYSKTAKRREWTTVLTTLGPLVATGSPDALKMFNYVFGEFVKLMGDEYQNFAKVFLSQIQSESGGQMQQPGQLGAPPVSNQNQIPMTGAEMGTRGIANIGAI